MKKLILKWLGVDKQIAKLEEQRKTDKQNMDWLHNEVLSLRKLIHISIDVDNSNTRSRDSYRSWCVISIEGKRDYLKFFYLGESDLRHIQSFLKQFDRDRVTADLPYMMSKNFFLNR